MPPVLTPDYSPGLVVPSNRWGPNPWLAAQAYQRHLLQLACTDRLLGEFLRRLRALGVYDRSLIVVTADQGVSVQAGQSRRSVDPAHPTNLAHLRVSFRFFKRPGQQHGRVVDTHVRTLDIGATIADVLGIKIPWHVDGRSFFRPGHSPEVNFLTGRGWAHADVHALARQRASTVRRNAALFGGGLLRLGPASGAAGPAGVRPARRARGRAGIDRRPGCGAFALTARRSLPEFSLRR